jgi:hypothetical protein
MRAQGNSNAKSPGLGQFLSSKIFRQSTICMNPVVGSQYGAMTEAGKSLISQLYSQGKLTIRRDAKIEKFDMKTRF